VWIITFPHHAQASCDSALANGEDCPDQQRLRITFSKTKNG
jgi:hypothetical protein